MLGYSAIVFCPFFFFGFRRYRTDTTTYVFSQLKRTAMSGTFYECDTASLVSSTVDIGDCRVRSVVGEVRYRAEYTIMVHGTSGSERKRVDWASSLSLASIRLSPSFAVISSMAALHWVDSALTIAVGIARLLRLQFNSWLIAPEPYL